ncbi:MAG: hypothetical protein [Caudoviricetes sp.]|nr:MAG: hypothetical protein [Caudoviricetes sp.]
MEQLDKKIDLLSNEDLKKVITNFLFDDINVKRVGFCYIVPCTSSCIVHVVNLFTFINKVTIFTENDFYEFTIYSHKLWKHLIKRSNMVDSRQNV